MLTKEIIENFGFPKSLKGMDLVYCFDDELGDEAVMGSGCVCTDISAKFFLYNPKNHDTVFTMHFEIEQAMIEIYLVVLLLMNHMYIFFILKPMKNIEKWELLRTISIK